MMGVTLGRMGPDRWREYRDLRLRALRSDPAAFSSSYSEEARYTGAKWRERLRGVLFAFSEGAPIGMIVYRFDDRIKHRHIAGIYGFYVDREHRGRGIGNMLLDRALSELRRNPRAKKVEISAIIGRRSARSMYRRAGFREVGTARRSLRLNGRFYDEVLMEMLL